MKVGLMEAWMWHFINGGSKSGHSFAAKGLPFLFWCSLPKWYCMARPINVEEAKLLSCLFSSNSLCIYSPLSFWIITLPVKPKLTWKIRFWTFCLFNNLRQHSNFELIASGGNHIIFIDCILLCCPIVL